ncbi:hypothetical protein EAH84_13910 [Sphingomonas oligophenolica]|uniref:Uncharacterized protein n=2 Tax=Sphingomonas oligophenolica TaxID=301154 RepID=A0A502C9P8_9SPHN|nr:hypothetical protein EAH84_13910 [Sphingomonas oligophenolica]
MQRSTILIALAVAAIVCPVKGAPRRYITPSYAIAHAAQLDGQWVTIGGFVDLGTNSRCLYESMQAVRGKNGIAGHVVTLSGGDNLLRRRAELNHKFVIVSGTFKRTFNAPDVIDLYQCNDVGIEQEVVRRSEP